MAKIERFEDLQSWQKARQLANLIYDLTEHPGFCKDYHLRGQIQDAVGSVMHNIAEGFDAGTNPEFIRFLKMARLRQAKYSQNSILPWIEIMSVRMSLLSLIILRPKQSDSSMA
jgi:hypothetical protein